MDVSLHLIIAQVINFTILMVILSILFKKLILPFMHKRADDLKKGFADIETSKKEIESMRQEYVAQMQDIRNKAKLEIDKAVAEGSSIRDGIVHKAEEDSKALLEKAKREIEMEGQKAVTTLQKEVATLSILVAEKLIKQRMDENTSRALVNDFIEEISKESPKC